MTERVVWGKQKVMALERSRYCLPLFPPDSHQLSLLHVSLPVSWFGKKKDRKPPFPVSPYSSLSFFLLFFPFPHSLGVPDCRELVSDGISPGAAHSNLHPQQSHIHAHGAHRDQQDPCGRDQTRGPGGGEHPGGGRPLQRCFRGIPGQRDAGPFQRRPGPTIRGCVFVRLQYCGLSWMMPRYVTGVFIGSERSFFITNIYDRRA